MKAPASARSVGIIIVEPLNVLRAALRQILEALPDMNVVGEAGSAKEGLEVIRRLPPRPRTLVLISLESPAAGESFRLISSIHEEFPVVPILVTAARADNVLISRAFFVGADSFVAHDRDVSELIEAIRRTADGEMVMRASHPSRTVRTVKRKVPRGRTILTAREIQVLTVAADGLTARQVARRLNIRERTVTAHFGHIYKKLGVSNRSAALTAASDAGLLDVSVRQVSSIVDKSLDQANLSAS